MTRPARVVTILHETQDCNRLEAAHDEASRRKLEVALLAGSLLDAHSTAAAAGATISGAQSPASEDTLAFGRRAAAALPLLLAAYGATSGASDRALLAVLHSIDRLGSRAVAASGCSPLAAAG